MVAYLFWEWDALERLWLLFCSFFFHRLVVLVFVLCVILFVVFLVVFIVIIIILLVCIVIYVGFLWLFRRNLCFDFYAVIG